MEQFCVPSLALSSRNIGLGRIFLPMAFFFVATTMTRMRGASRKEEPRHFDVLGDISGDSDRGTEPDREAQGEC